ncbi:MAG: hypothetical protein HY297_05910 [Thaumarchaeota archaeon]|nr:hypothetical protein [Nitrososphaerota archaeon]
MAIEQFFEIEPGGVIKTKAAGARVFFVSTRGWAVIEKQLTKVFSSGAAVMLNEMGSSYGRGVAKEVMGFAKDPGTVLKVLEELSAAAGWGSIEVKGDIGRGEVLEVVITDCAFCADGELGPQPRCQFVGGVTAGVASEAFAAAFRATETQCLRKGDTHCVFHLERAGPSAE